MSTPRLIERDVRDFTLAFRAAFDASATKRTELSREVLRTVNVAPRRAAHTVFGALPALRALRAEITAVSSEAAARLDELESLAESVMFAQTVYETTAAPAEQLPLCVEEAKRLRTILVADVRALAMHGLVPENALRGLRRPVGLTNIAADLANLVQILRSCWDIVGTKIPLLAADLDKAEGLSEHLLRTAARRTKRSELVTAAAEERQRALTLLLDAYDEVRRAVAFVRWREGDAATMAPSALANSGGTRRRGKKEGVQATEASSSSSSPSPSPADEGRAHVADGSDVLHARHTPGDAITGDGSDSVPRRTRAERVEASARHVQAESSILGRPFVEEDEDHFAHEREWAARAAGGERFVPE
jgi:hypothetical protein